MALPVGLQSNLRIPLIGASMFIVSVPDLLVAHCTAGIVGAFPALNARPQSALDNWIREIRDRLDDYAAARPDGPVAPFAVHPTVHASKDPLPRDRETGVRH